MDQVEKSPLYSLSMNTEPDQKEAADKLDRFIPKKLCANLYNLYFADESRDKAKKENLDCNQVEMQDRANSRYNDLLKSHLLGSDGVVSSESVRKKAQPKFIKFATDTKGTKLDLLLSNEKDISPKLTLDSKIQRNISKAPYKVLDAPGLSDDYYLNLMDWSSNNLIGIGLENYVYFWSSTNSRVTK
jgi:hypothetical protein